MGEIKETISVEKTGKNEYTVCLNKIEKMKYDELAKVHVDIDKALQDTKKQIDEIPAQVTTREKMLRDQLNTLESRLKAFGAHLKPAAEDPSIG